MMLKDICPFYKAPRKVGEPQGARGWSAVVVAGSAVVTAGVVVRGTQPSPMGAFSEIRSLPPLPLVPAW